jgi:uncharacterized protein YjaG (DUF416 family)
LLRDQIDHIVDRVGRLPVLLGGVYFACCGERLLPACRSFQLLSDFGDPAVLRQALDWFWNMVAKEEGLDGGTLLLDRIAAQTPDADDFDNVSATVAQDCCICIDAAIRALVCPGEMLADWAEYPLEAVRVAVMADLTGFLDSGDDDEGRAAEQAVVRDARFVKEMAFQESLLDDLESGPSRGMLLNLRERSVAEAWTPEVLVLRPNDPAAVHRP